MAFARIACCACGALACAAAAPAAQAAPVWLLGEDGRTRVHEDRFAPTLDLPAPPSTTATRRPARAVSARRRTVIGELKRLRDDGSIDPAAYSERRAAYEDARRTVQRLDGRRRLELGSVVRILEDLAARRQLTPSRLAPLWLTLERNRRWWTTGPLLSSGRRVGFEGSELVWQYYAGQGLQLQVLGTFGKLNGLWGAKTEDDRVGRLVDEVLPLAAERGGGLAWEYYFSFGGGRPPWVSGMAQATGLQALGRSAVRLGRREDVWPVTSRALRVFEQRSPSGVRVSVGDGAHYALYSFAPGLRVLNGFTQAVVGLHDYAGLANDPRAWGLYDAGEREARREVPAYDTGAWSLYSRLAVTHESDLGYHNLLRSFLRSLCTRTREPVYCDTARSFRLYLGEAPLLVLATRRLRGGRTGRLRFELSKISSVALRITRGERVLVDRAAGVLGYGTRTMGWAVPRRAGAYTVTLSARDLAGNSGTTTATVEVVAPR